ncbi:MAG: hypothetical protein ABW137_04170 [Mycobacterium sp.]
MITHPRRWWLLGALRRGRVVRTVDRVEAWTALAVIVLVLVGIHPVAGFARDVYTTNSAAFAAEAATRHTVQAVAVNASQTATRGVGSAYQVQVQWFAGNETRDKVVRIDRAVVAGEHIPIWVNDAGQVTTPPRTDADARTDAIGAGAIVWLVTVAAGAAALTAFRRVLDRLRYHAWDRGLRALADNDGGWATRNS